MLMTVPLEFQNSKIKTDVYGNLDALQAYIESGENVRHWFLLLARTAAANEESFKKYGPKWDALDLTKSGAVAGEVPKKETDPLDASIIAERLQRASAAIDRWYAPPGQIRTLSL